MRRPPYGVSVMRGLLLIWKKMKINISHGYVPSWWTPVDRQDVDRAMRWLGKFIDWVEWRKEESDGAAEVADESGGTPAEEQGQVESEARGEEAEEPDTSAASAQSRFDPDHILAGADRARPD
jgi:hypothetical protein